MVITSANRSLSRKCTADERFPIPNAGILENKRKIGVVDEIFG
jgi:rRNA processing protein Gar1